jgi:FtsH-binding integral membrane protein
LRATVVVMPGFVLALTNPSFYLAAVMKSVSLAQQAGATDAGSAGRELVGSTVAGAALALLVWIGLSLRPNLLMLALWLTAAALWAGARAFRLRPTAFPPSFWINALVTMLILLGPAIEDSTAGKGVLRASAIRVTVFLGVALYAWAAVWALQRLRDWRTRAAARSGQSR